MLPALPEPGDTHAWHLYVVRIADEAPVDRDGFIAAMSDQGIGTSVHFIPLHMHSIWRESLGVNAAQFPVATREFAGAVSLPLFSAMTDAQAARVVDAVVGILT